jgi:hypothetical protein
MILELLESLFKGIHILVEYLTQIIMDQHRILIQEPPLNWVHTKKIKACQLQMISHGMINTFKP